MTKTTSASSAPRSPADARGYIGPHMVLRGHLSGHGDVRCDGVLEGSVALEGALVVGRAARIHGPVRARAVAVEGHLEGPVTAGELNVLAGGRLLGDVRAARIGLDDGGSLEGTVDMEVELPELEEAP